MGVGTQRVPTPHLMTIIMTMMMMMMMIAIPPADDNFEDHRLTIGQQQWWRANTSKTCLAVTSVTGNFDSVSENPH